MALRWFPQQWAEGLFILCLSWVGLSCSLYFINRYPQVTVDEQGLSVAFMWFHVQVAWKDVEAVQLVETHYLPQNYSIWFVKTKQLTPLHKRYGLTKTGYDVPGFLVHSDLEGHTELLQIIERHIGTNQQLTQA